MAQQVDEEDSTWRKRRFVIEDEDIDEEALIKDSIDKSSKLNQSQKIEEAGKIFKKILANLN